MSNLPRVSVVINTYNRAASLEAALHSLHRQNYPYFEIIAVNGPSTDGTLDLLKTYSSSIRVGRCSDRNLSVSRNVGIEMARGDLVAFIDDDAVADEDWLLDAAAAFDSAEVGGVGGFVYDHTGYSLQYSYTLCDRLGNAYHNIPVSMPEFCYPGCFRYPALLGTNSIFRRDALLEIGGFDEQFDYFLDETDVNLRLIDAGYVLKQIPNAFVYHRYLSSDIRNEAKINVNYLPIIRNRIYFSLKNAPTAPGFASTLLNDWAKLSRDAEYNVRWNIEQGNLDQDVLDRFHRDLEVAVREGLQFGLNRPRRLLGSEAAIASRGPVAYDLFDEQHRGEFKPCPRVLSPSQKLTVCLLSQQYPPGVVGGIGRLTHDLACGLADGGHNVHVLTRTSAAINTVDYERGVWVHRLTCDREEPPPPPDITVPRHIWQYSARLLRELHRIHQTHPIDIVEAPIWDTEGIAAVLDGSFPVVTNLETPWKVWRETNANLLHHTPAEDQFFIDQAAAETLVMERSTAVRGISHAIVETMRKYYGIRFRPNQVSVVPLGMEDRSQGLAPPKKGSFVDILFVGRFEHRKGIDVLLEAIPAFCRKFPQARFVLVGEEIPQPDGTEFGAVFRGTHARAPFCDRVIFTGKVSDEQLETQLAECDIFVSPSRYESFGLVFIEAMMFGKPVVGCRSGGMEEVIQEGVTGLLAEPGDPQSLQAALATLLSDPARREAFGKAGRQRFLDHYTRQIFTSRSLNLYQQVLASAVPSATQTSATAPLQLVEKVPASHSSNN